MGAKEYINTAWAAIGGLSPEGSAQVADQAAAVFGTIQTNLEDYVDQQLAIERSYEAGHITDAINAALLPISGSASPPDFFAGTVLNLVAADAGKHKVLTSSSPITINLPLNATDPTPLGTFYDLSRLGTGLPTVAHGGAASTIAVRSFAETVINTVGSGPFNINMPPSVSTGDGILVFIVCAGARTFAASGFAPVGTNPGAAGTASYVFEKTNAAGSLAGTTVPFTLTGSAINLIAIAVAYSGVSKTEMLADQAGVATANTGTTATTPALTLTADGQVEVSFISRASGATGGSTSVAPSPIVLDKASFTTATASNVSAAVGHGPLTGTLSGQNVGTRAWTPQGFGTARTLLLAPDVSAGAIVLSADNAYNLRAQYSAGSATKVAMPDTWLLRGDFA